MSIFQTKEWWSTKVGQDEEFQPSHVCVANIDNETPERPKLLIGSFSGFLRVYLPVRREFRIEDQLYEQSFNSPIVELQAGKFLLGEENIYLAILFFKKIAIYSFSTAPKQGMSAKLVSENTLARNAYNMTIGRFGGTKKDMICVQSCDGMLMIFEADKLSCMAQIQDFVLPGPLVYYPVLDCFAIQNSNYEVEVYRYSSIGAIHNSAQKDSKKLQSDWSFNVGEMATDMVCVKRGDKTQDLLVLSESMLFVIAQNGTLKNQKKFDYTPMSISVYQNNDPKYASNEAQRPLNFIIASTTHHLLVYSDFQLIWATKTNYIAHGIQVTTFDSTPGLILTLNDKGWLELSYVGTDPPKLTSVTGERKEIDYEKANQDYVKTIQQIDRSESQGRNSEASESLNVHAQAMGVGKYQGYLDAASQYFKGDDGQVIYSKVRISLTYNGIQAQNLSVFFNLPANITTPDNPILIDSIKGNSTPFQFDIELFTLKNLCPSKGSFEILVNFSNIGSGKTSMKDVRTASCTVQIPVALQAKTVPPIKNANFKLTINGKVDTPNLQEIFGEVAEVDPKFESHTSNPNVISFQMSNGVDITILIAKSSSKYRLQSSTFEGLYYITSVFLEKLAKLHGKPETEIPAVCEFSDSLPLQDFFIIIDEHLQLRNDLTVMKKELEVKADEFRTIEKRILTRFKDRNPTPLNNLDILLETCYRQILDTGTRIEESQQALKAVSAKLSISVRLIHLLSRLRFNLPHAFMEELLSYVSDEVLGDEEEFGWEEFTYSNLSYLIKYMATASKGNPAEIRDIQLQKIDDSQKVKKAITNLLDKIAKYGGNLPLPNTS